MLILLVKGGGEIIDKRLNALILAVFDVSIVKVFEIYIRARGSMCWMCDKTQERFICRGIDL